MVVVDGEEINHTNVEDKFRWCTQVIEEEKDEIDHEHIRECFKSIETIIDPTHTGNNEIDDFWQCYHLVFVWEMISIIEQSPSSTGVEC